MSKQTLDYILEKIRDLASTCGYDGTIPTDEEMKEIEALIRQEQIKLLDKLIGLSEAGYVVPVRVIQQIKEKLSQPTEGGDRE